jgi:hypothetical protein
MTDTELELYGLLQRHLRDTLGPIQPGDRTDRGRVLAVDGGYIQIEGSPGLRYLYHEVGKSYFLLMPPVIDADHPERDLVSMVVGHRKTLSCLDGAWTFSTDAGRRVCSGNTPAEAVLKALAYQTGALP